MKTSTLCMGSLSLVLLAAGAAGLADATAGPRANGERAWSPLAVVSDALAGWMMPSRSAAESSTPVVARPDAATKQPSRSVARVFKMELPPMAPAVSSPCSMPDGLVVVPDWDCQDWKTLNAESLPVAPNVEIRMRGTSPLSGRSLRRPRLASRT